MPVCRLTEIFRQAAESQIVTNAHRVNARPAAGIPGKDEATPARRDFYFVEAEDPEQAVELIRAAGARGHPAAFRLDPMDDIQVLTPMQRGELGARNLNAVLQAGAESRGRRIERFGWTFRERRQGDADARTTTTRTSSTATSAASSNVDAVEREMRGALRRPQVPYDFQELDELMPAYAITIHKSQGSEYPCVVIPDAHPALLMLQRNLLYTAITRGRQLVVLVGTQKAMAIAVRAPTPAATPPSATACAKRTPGPLPARNPKCVSVCVCACAGNMGHTPPTHTLGRSTV